MNPEVLPQKPLNSVADLVRLAPPETSTKAHIDATLDYLEARMDRWSAEQDRRLMKAEKRISLCAYLHSALKILNLDPSDSSIHHRHFSWCPFEQWMGNEYQGIQEIFGGHRHR